MASENQQLQDRIAAARRDAEGLKDRIKRKKDELADASRKLSIFPGQSHLAVYYMLCVIS